MVHMHRVGKATINQHVKFLCIKEMLCYEVSPSAVIAYFQMGETISHQCLSMLMRGVTACNAFADVYLCKPSKSDAKKIVGFHLDEHKIPEMMGALDMTKIHFQN